MRSTTLAMTFLAAVAACGGNTRIEPDGTAASSSSSEAATSTTTGGGMGGSAASAGGSEGVGGVGGVGGTGGAKAACLDQTSEACMVVGAAEKPRRFVGLTVEASRFIGGIDRWVFDFTWLYDDPTVDDEEEVVELPVRIMRLGPMYEPKATPVTWSYPLDSGMPLEVLDGTYTVLGIASMSYDLVPVTGTLTVRQANNQFEGSIAFSLAESSQPNAASIEVAGPFSVAVPP